MIQVKRILRKNLVVLLILDGVGYRTIGSDNAVLLAKKPFLDYLIENYSFGTINASESYVGLPDGQFGNSEVGHLNIGAGRVVEQDITLIDSVIKNNTLSKNENLLSFLGKIKNRLQILILLSDGGVHSHIDHLFAFCKVAIDFGIKKIVVHPFLDGRDAPPKSALKYLTRLEDFCKNNNEITIGSVCGRFFSMDRDNRWDRIEKSYNALLGIDSKFYSKNSIQALEMAYKRGETDEFISPTIISKEDKIDDNDSLLFLNFRSDRARQILSSIIDKDFKGFNRRKVVNLSNIASITSYGDKFNILVLFPAKEIKNVFGEYISSLGLTQLRIAETEKYPHVTYFFSGGREKEFEGEDRILIPSPLVKTYDLKPQMSAIEVTNKIIENIESDKYNVVICNFANGDMVGHTGNIKAAIKSIEVLDKCIERVTNVVLKKNGELLITADHGNCEKMFDDKNEQVHTQHTTNKVPFIYVGQKASIRSGGSLKDVAPTLLFMLGLPIPKEMTGDNLIIF